MIPKEVVKAVEVLKRYGINAESAVLKKVQQKFNGKSITKEKPKPVIKSVEKKTDEQLIAEHIQTKGVTKERNSPAKKWNGVQYVDYDGDILGKKEIGSKVKLPFNDLTIDVVLIMVDQGWLSCRQITEFNFGKENFDNSYDKEVRIEIYKLEDRRFIDKKIEGINRHFYKLNTRGLEFINRKTGGR